MADRALAAMAASPLRDAGRGRVLPLRHAARLVGAALRADADRQRPAARRRARRRTTPTSPRGVAGFLRDVLQRPAGGFGAAQDSESWIDGARSEGGYYATGCRGPPRPRAAGRRRQGRHRLERPRHRRARPRGRPARRPGADRGGALGGRRRARRQRRSRRAARARVARRDRRRARRRRSPTTASSRPGSPRSPSRPGEAAYAVRARELVDACVGRRTGAIARARRRGPGARRAGRRCSGCRIRRRRAVGPRRAGRSRRDAVDAGRGRRAPRPRGADRRRARAQTLCASLSRTARCSASPRCWRCRRGSSSSSRPTRRPARGGGPRHPRRRRRDGHRRAGVARGRRAGFSLFADKSLRDGVATAYDCRDFACRLPVTDPADLAR